MRREKRKTVSAAEKGLLRAKVEHNDRNLPEDTQVSWECLMEKMMVDRGNVNLPQIYVQDLDIKPESANELLDFLAFHSEGVEHIIFIKWLPTASSIEKEILSVLAEKSAPTLQSLTVKMMKTTTE